MTAYALSNFFGQTNVTNPTTMALKAGTYSLKIAQVEAAPCTSTLLPFAIYHYTGATLSGGTTITPAPLRDGAPAASASAKINPTITGTSSLLHAEFQNSTALLSYKFPFVVIIAPGNAILLSTTQTTTGSGAYNILAANIYFEELRLAWSY